MIGLAYRWASLKDPFKEIIGARLYTLMHIKIFKIPVHLLNYLEVFVNIWSTITFLLFLVKHYRANIFLKLQLNFQDQFYEIFLDFAHSYQEDLRYRQWNFKCDIKFVLSSLYGFDCMFFTEKEMEKNQNSVIIEFRKK